MKQIVRLNEKQLINLVERTVNEINQNTVKRQNLNEGSTWEGIKGYFRGKGYYYTKYLSQVQDLIEKLQKKIINDKKIESDLYEILEDVTESSMEDYKKKIILDLMTEISNTIKGANENLEYHIRKIKNLKL